MNLLIDHFHELTRRPELAAKLKTLILQLAVQGKLVPQDPADEPASELLKRIQAEKERLREKSGRNNNHILDFSNQFEEPFQIPNNWLWIKLGEAVHIIMGQSPPSSTYNQVEEGIPFYQGKADFGDIYPTPRYWCTSPRKYSQSGDVLISVRAPVGPVNINQGETCIGRGLAAIRPLARTETFYLFYLLRAFGSQFSKMGTGTTFKAISAKDLHNFFIPMPPLNEQKRIVAKVESLLQKVDETVSRAEKTRQTRISLGKAALQQLSNGISPGELRTGWRRIEQHFSDLFSAAANVQELRQTILQLAVQGKLVPQDPADEPASELLKRIQAEKERLVEAGEIRKEKPLPAIVINHTHEKLPGGWKWVHIWDIAIKVTDGEHATPQRSSKGYFLLSARNVTNNGIDLTNVDYVPKSEFERIRKRCNPDKGDILISCSGSVGRVCIVDASNKYVMVRSAALIKHSQANIDSAYLAYTLQSPLLQDQISKKSRTSAQSNLFLGKIKELLLPIPPLNEQKRIVAKVESLMQLCDHLEGKIAGSEQVAERLMDVVVKTISTY